MKVQNLSQIQITHDSPGGLRNGSTVKGRVMALNDNGSYTISLAGQAINVSSRVPLNIGSAFQAKILVQDNKILLHLLNNEFSSIQTQKFYPEDLEKIPLAQNLQDYLTGMGLPLEGDSLRLLQFMRENGVRFDFEKLRRIFSRNARDEHKSEKVQASIILEEKGIDCQPQIVDGILFNDNSGQQQYTENDDSEQNDDEEVFQLEPFFDEVDKACENKRFGPLTFFNTFSEGENHWVILPFEWSYNHTTGDFRVFYNRVSKTPGKIIISCATDLKKYIFKLKLNKGIASSVEFAVEPPLNLEIQQNLLFEFKEKLSILSKNNSIKIEIADYKVLQGFSPENEPVTILRETV